MLTFEQIKLAEKRISAYIARTPLFRLQNLDKYLGCEVYVKAENMQNTGAFKLRGAMNKILSLPSGQIKRGIVTASSGNHGRAVAYAAKMFGAHADVVMPDTSSEIKKAAIGELGAEIHICDALERFALAAKIGEEKGSVFIPPFNDEEVMAGQGTVGIEMLEQLPDVDVFVIPISGGGLIGGVSTAVKNLAPEKKVYGAEPANLPRYSESLKAGKIVTVEKKPTVADGLVALSPGEICFPSVQKYTDGVFAVSEENILKALKLLVQEGKIFAEPSSCVGMAAALQGLLPITPKDKVCFLLSGGNADIAVLKMTENIEI